MVAAALALAAGAAAWVGDGARPSGVVKQHASRARSALREALA